MQPVYRRVLGPDFDRLPPRVGELHEVREPVVWRGLVDVERGRSPVCRLIATLFSLPPDGAGQPLTVCLAPRGEGETWERRFGRAIFRSWQKPDGHGRVIERVGPASLAMRTVLDDTGLHLTLDRVALLGIPLPRLVCPEIATTESERDGRYHFEVAARLPGFGSLVRYAGWLERALATEASG